MLEILIPAFVENKKKGYWESFENLSEKKKQQIIAKARAEALRKKRK